MTRRTITILSPTSVARIRKPGRYGDGRGSRGLSLLVKVLANGRISKTWSQRLLIDGKPVMKGLGSFPEVGLAQARKQCIENKGALIMGLDPFGPKVPALIPGVPSVGSTVPSFRAALKEVIKLQSGAWKGNTKTEASWRHTMSTYVLPRIGHLAVDAISPGDCMAVVSPVWTAKQETGRRVLRRLSAVMKWARAQGYRQDNPAEDIRAALPKQTKRVEHRRSIHHSRIPEVLQVVKGSARAWVGTKLAFEFLALTGVRSGEVRGARWSEIDLQGRQWTIPSERTKTTRAHVVPLSSRAIEVLTEAEAIRDGSGLVFPSIRGKEMSDNTLSKILRENDIEMVPHGLRAALRSWCSDTNQNREASEMVLGHVVGDATERAYARADLLKHRRELLEAWAQYLTSKSGKVVKFSA